MIYALPSSFANILKLILAFVLSETFGLMKSSMMMVDMELTADDIEEIEPQKIPATQRPARPG